MRKIVIINTGGTIAMAVDQESEKVLPTSGKTFSLYTYWKVLYA